MEKQLPHLQASKWLTFQALVEIDELKRLFKEFEDFHIYQIGKVVTEEEAKVSKDDFLHHYGVYLESLRNGQEPTESLYRSLFTLAITQSPIDIALIPIQPEKYITRILKPVIQVQLHHMHHSKLDGKIRPMVFGSNSHSWGLQFSYPQIYLNAETQNVESALDETTSNAYLFKKLQKWVRAETLPTTFIFEGNRLRIPIRIGKECLSWIQNHPTLSKDKLKLLKTGKDKDIQN